MKDNILIVGGYGKVGQIISTHLTTQYPKKVIIAGRSFKKAEQLASQLQNQAIPYLLDIHQPATLTILENTKLVIMCIDQKDTDFVKLCIQHEVHYIDITANTAFMQKVELLHDIAILNKTALTMSVGLAPGISNLLAQHCANTVTNTSSIDLFILLGLGEKHGKAAYEWTVDNIHTTYNIVKAGKLKNVASFTQPKKSNLVGERLFYTFNFSDQHSLASTLSIDQVMTRMAFDSKLTTAFIAFLRRIGATAIFRSSKIRKLMVILLEKISFGSDIYAVKATAENKLNERYSYSLQGNGEGKITAFVAIETARYMLENIPSFGVYHLHQVIKDIPSFLNDIKKYDQSIEIRSAEN